MSLCALCLFVRPAPDAAITIMGGYAVCRRHAPIIGATLGREWASILVIAGMPAHDAQANPRPLPPRPAPPPPTRPQPRTGPA